MKRALVSVSDKRGIAALCRVLAERGVEILSTGGTARALIADGIPVVQVSEHTGSPEIMDGRVKTLHPKIHGGILARRGMDEEVMAANDIGAIDLVVVNLYPFRECIAQPDCTLETAIENIDIGGPTMLRAAAKNHRDVAVVVDPDDYDLVVAQLKANGDVDAATKFKLAAKAFEHSADYEAAIANYLGGLSAEGEDEKEFPQTLRLTLSKKQTMRYGENPHQAAAFYASSCDTGIAAAKQLQGKPLSFNNIADADAAWQCVAQFTEPTCVIVKHANPCGVAIGETQCAAYERAFATDPESAFGGVIAFNQPLTGDTAAAITAKQFAEVIIAPAVSNEARAALAAKADIRVLECDAGVTVHSDIDLNYRTVTGGMLVQHTDLELLHKTEVVTKRAPSEEEMRDLLFAWQVAKFVKSNAIVYANACATIGVGAGQMSRVNSARIAAIKAQHANLPVRGAVMASDAFFPFRDGLDNAAEVGIRAVIQPGGSKRDDEVIAAADEHQMAMVFTAMRHFRH